MSAKETNIIFLSGDFEPDHPDILTYNKDIVNLIKKSTEKMKRALTLYNPSYLMGEEIIYDGHIFNIILKGKRNML